MTGIVTVLTGIVFLEGGATEIGIIGIVVGLVLTMIVTEDKDD